MMNGLFSMFEPYYTNNTILYLLPFTPMLFNTMETSKMTLTMKKITSFMTKEMSSITSNKFMLQLMVNTLLANCFLNLISMTPYSFTMNSMMSIVFPLSCSMFLSILMASMIKKPIKLMSHLVPKSSPMAMSPFMVIIELTSLMIRPITLSIRLIANMTAGHLMMHLTAMLFYSMKSMMLITPIMSMALMMVEMFMSMIQAYIFATLLTIYSSE